MGKNFLVTVKDGEATVEERSFVQGLTDGITTLVSGDTASVGYAKTAAVGALIYGAMILTKQKHTGQWSVNPF